MLADVEGLRSLGMLVARATARVCAMVQELAFGLVMVGQVVKLLNTKVYDCR